jgi:cytochrome b subunit of formate dehydrogenase
MVSFATLVYTGFALKYPDSTWARPLQQWEDGLGLRGWLHRAAAVVMIAALGVHVAHLAMERRARSCIARMRPRMEDLRELRERLAYYVGLRKRSPEVPELGYPEKLEYIALMWGIVIMSVTGFALWLDDIVLKWLPKWVSDVATVVHFYEAVLATLAIVVWHLYFVIFDPVVYPMDTAWITGRAPLARVLERRHAARAPSRERKAPSETPVRAGEAPPEKVTEG